MKYYKHSKSRSVAAVQRRDRATVTLVLNIMYAGLVRTQYAIVLAAEHHTRYSAE